LSFGYGHRDLFSPTLQDIARLRSYHVLGMRVIGHPIESCMLPSAADSHCHVCYLSRAGIEITDWGQVDEGDFEIEFDYSSDEDAADYEESYQLEVEDEIAFREHMELAHG
jgi:hypothetical protein